MSWLSSWYADCTEGMTTNSTDSTVTTSAWTRRMFVAMPRSFVRWNHRGRNPARATACRPVAGPATHVVTPARTPTASIAATTGPAQPIPAQASRWSNAWSRLVVRLMSCCGTTTAIVSVPSVSTTTATSAATRIASG
ncbi:hypothetical protein NSA53_02590 [Cellulosimicrobium cellulans]|nr:hypothetical protein [Cellulosimicrobium cellulans]